YTPQGAGIFQAYVSLKPGNDVESIRTALLGEVYRLRTHEVEPAELEKVKTQVMLNTVDGLKTVHGKAEALAISEIYHGNPLSFLSDLERYNAVTPADLKRVAQKYLVPQRARFVVLKPKE